MTYQPQLRFDNKVVIVTGAGGGLGKAYALFFGSRGASVVVNDLGGSLKGEGSADASSHRPADVVVNQIKEKGGKAVANYDSVEDGDKIVETAVKEFGTVHIVINNAGILRDVSFKKQTDKDWQLVLNVHLYGSYKVAHAAWPYMRKQKFGRIINTASAAGLYGNFGQTNYSAAKLGLVGFSETLSKEGEKYNIFVNAIAPIAASRMTETVMPPELLEKIVPEYIVPFVAYLTHENTAVSGETFELGAGYYTRIRWERSGGSQFKADDSFTPSAILGRLDEVLSIHDPSYPSGPHNFLEAAENSNKLGPNKQGPACDLKDKVVIVTGAGAGIGRAYALHFAKLGAKLVINDFANPQGVVDEIKAMGGQAVGNKSNVVDGEAVVQSAIDAFGTVHAIVNNAGILRDKSFLKMTDADWKIVMDVHLNGTRNVTKAAWPYFLKQNYGRVVNTTSTSGIYGNFGQANYAAAKAAILGFSRALAVEGAKNNILVNAIAPNAGTAMTKGLIPDELFELFKPDYIAPLTALLCSDKLENTGELFEVGSGWIGRTRWQRSGGVRFHKKDVTPEDISVYFGKIEEFDDRATNPTTPAESTTSMLNFDDENGVHDVTESLYEFKSRDVSLYNLGVGARASDLKYVYENDEDFQPVQTFGVIPPFSSLTPYNEALPNFSPMKLLHGEQFLEIINWPPPSEGKLVVKDRIIEVLDKGKAAIATTENVILDQDTGVEYFRNVASMFVRGAGGFGGHSKPADKGPVTAANVPPKRDPDEVFEFKTLENQAALYRLSGDYNPLHIDPAFAAAGNFDRPILHGLCTLGISARLLVDKYGLFKNIKCRFLGHVFPGETLKVLAWKEGTKVIFETHVVERKTKAIGAAAIELKTEGGKL